MSNWATIESGTREWHRRLACVWHRLPQRETVDRHAHFTQASFGLSVLQSPSPSISNLRHFRPFPPSWLPLRSGDEAAHSPSPRLPSRLRPFLSAPSAKSADQAVARLLPKPESRIPTPDPLAAFAAPLPLFCRFLPPRILRPGAAEGVCRSKSPFAIAALLEFTKSGRKRQFPAPRFPRTRRSLAYSSGPPCLLRALRGEIAAISHFFPPFAHKSPTHFPPDLAPQPTQVASGRKIGPCLFPTFEKSRFWEVLGNQGLVSLSSRLCTSAPRSLPRAQRVGRPSPLRLSPLRLFDSSTSALRSSASRTPSPTPGPRACLLYCRWLCFMKSKDRHSSQLPDGRAECTRRPLPFPPRSWYNPTSRIHQRLRTGGVPAAGLQREAPLGCEAPRTRSREGRPGAGSPNRRAGFSLPARRPRVRPLPRRARQRLRRESKVAPREALSSLARGLLSL